MKIPKSVKKKTKSPAEKRRKIDILLEACEEEYGKPPWTAEQIMKVSKRLKREKRYTK